VYGKIVSFYKVIHMIPAVVEFTDLRSFYYMLHLEAKKNEMKRMERIVHGVIA
jgi:hypothetical protein